jgi:hypothetical protein
MPVFTSWEIHYLWKAGAPRSETSDVINFGMIAEAVP